MTVSKAIAQASRLLPGIPAPDGENDPRWQAIIAVGHYVESDPDEVWGFVAQWGSHEQPDLRAAVATCLLEHLLEYHFDLIFPRVQTLAERNALFADTVRQCWKFGQAKSAENSRKVDALVARLRPGQPPN